MRNEKKLYVYIRLLPIQNGETGGSIHIYKTIRRFKKGPFWSVCWLFAIQNGETGGWATQGTLPQTHDIYISTYLHINFSFFGGYYDRLREMYRWALLPIQNRERADLYITFRRFSKKRNLVFDSFLRFGHVHQKSIKIEPNQKHVLCVYPTFTHSDWGNGRNCTYIQNNLPFQKRTKHV